jgi:hypothetical protein
MRPAGLPAPGPSLLDTVAKTVIVADGPGTRNRTKTPDCRSQSWLRMGRRATPSRENFRKTPGLAGAFPRRARLAGSRAVLETASSGSRSRSRSGSKPAFPDADFGSRHNPVGKRHLRQSPRNFPGSFRSGFRKYERSGRQHPDTWLRKFLHGARSRPHLFLHRGIGKRPDVFSDDEQPDLRPCDLYPKQLSDVRGHLRGLE